MATHTNNNQGDSPIKAAAAELNARVSCADLAERLGLPRDGKAGSFENPNDGGHHEAAHDLASSAINQATRATS